MQITPQVKQVVSSLPLAALQKKVVMGFDQCFYSKDYTFYIHFFGSSQKKTNSKTIQSLLESSVAT